jgi:NAD(P)-dependent dehydrogenase (short-subunit alcohol dehydrogenase family)
MSINQTRPLAVITGGRRGIGAGIAMELATRGFNLAITDVESDGIEEVIAAAQSCGSEAKFFQSNLAQVDGHSEVVRLINQWGGPITCLINNAGIPSPSRGDLLDVTPDSYDKVMDVNLRGTFFFTQEVVKHMLDTQTEFERSIVTVSSVSVELASIERAEYCLSKSGLGMLTRLFALRLAPHQIGVFEVRPGVIKTPMTETVAKAYDQRIAEGLVPMGRWGYPIDVARAVAALVDGKLAFSTGSVLHVDGALSLAKL